MLLLGGISVNFSSTPLLKYLQCLLTHRFRELGLLTRTEKRTELFDEKMSKVIDIYRSYGIISNVGAIAFISKFCADTLRLIAEGA